MVIASNDIQSDNIKSLIVYNPQWKLLLVTEQNVRFRNTIVVNPKDYYHFFKSAHYSNNKDYMRKNIGYLVAIARGANVIYDATDSVRATAPQHWHSIKWKTMHAVLFAGNTDYFNPYAHFGQSEFLPSGLPNLNQEEEYNKYLASVWRIPAIQHGMVSGVQNVRMTQGTQLQSAETTVIFNSRSPPVLIPLNVYSQFNSDNTIFIYRAFWALLLPKTDSIADAEVIRSFIAQRLLWEIDGYIGFHATSLHYHRKNKGMNIKSSSQDFTVKLVNFLRGWVCPESYSFFTCVEFLSFSLQKYELWHFDNYDIVRAWVEDLKTLGYTEPQRRLNRYRSPSRRFSDISKSPAIFNQPALLYYAPQETKLSHLSTQVESLRTMCPNQTEILTKLEKNKVAQPRIKNIMLVVAFNTPFTKVIKKIHPIHSLYFKHIVYCSNNSIKFEKDTENFYARVTYLRTYIGDYGALHYLCLNRAMLLSFDVDGYLLTGDDVLLNSWEFVNAPTDKIWFQIPPMYFYYNGSPIQDKWSWWNRPMGKRAYHGMWEDMTKLLLTGNPWEREVFKNFRRMLQKNGHGKADLFRAVADVVYIPRRLKRPAITLTEIFARHQVMVELALPTILGGLDNFKNFYRLRGLNLWHQSRSNFSRYKPGLHFMHPVKLSKVENKKKTFVCSRYLPLLFQ
ncbi:hypothetical protein LOTGIDRAFT_170097 [Lottia gigantea]|uniref:Uncharacterized protein n=1 Tax=Lottia gigantea TaxID=225164 RepID=V3ZN98_LOTGI|nr:hypothetical protein LOTGIDRAFT_170097 [Lottia gigantea]ESO82316.1 hypothetical protein LOTGIDRAFT_170097 [Lottia gigantea]